MHAYRFACSTEAQNDLTTARAELGELYAAGLDHDHVTGCLSLHEEEFVACEGAHTGARSYLKAFFVRKACEER